MDAGVEKQGDCVDCGICVAVCPTGIDIRKGIQYECIGCGACIDACDPVMDKVGLPRGLIRYTTENALAKHLSAQEIVAHILRPRILLYTAILGLIVFASAWSLATRVPLKVDIIRDRSMLAREADDGRIENVFNMKIMNTTEEPKRYVLAVDGMNGIEIEGLQTVNVASAENHEITVVVRVPPEAGKAGANTIYFEVKSIDNEQIKVREKASFLMP
jgi:cytochrome c oxidase accessory protein FixG